MVGRSAFIALGLISGATLMLELVLTRIFSVIMWYHMSLVTVSMAMFGLAMGALIVHRRPEHFMPERAMAACARYSLWFGILILASLLICLNTPYRTGPTLMAVFSIAYWNTVIAVPFVFSGVCVCASLTGFPRVVGKLYAADLAGAALGCIVVVWLLNRMDANSAIMFIASIAVLASSCFALAGGGGRRVGGHLLIAVLLAGAALANARTHFVRIQYVLNNYVGDTAWRHEFWNVFSYVTVDNPTTVRQYWGPGSKAAVNTPSPSLDVRMDTRASTTMVGFNGDWGAVNWLMCDATNLVHHIRSDGPALVIGVGAGRDLLSALIPSRGQRTVVGVDINPTMIDLLANIESPFAGHIARQPHVSLYVDEARSWIARSRDRFQVITIPLVDTSAASAAGAYALTENSLYTVEAFQQYLRHLSDDGVLSVSRWWYGGYLGETHRLAALAGAALRAEGVADPGQRVIFGRGRGLATLLLGARPFTESDLAKIQAASERCGFQILFPSAAPIEPALARAIDDPAWPLNAAFKDTVDLTASTDDRPFFFHSLRMTGMLKRFVGWAGSFQALGVAPWDQQAIVVLVSLLMLVTAAAFCVFFVPLIVDYRRSKGPFGIDSLAILSYFAAIGLGFMFFESSQVQRLNLFLGYPLYALTVVLFTLLLSSSLGAYLAGQLWDRVGPKSVRPICAALVSVLVVIGVGTPLVTTQFAGSTTTVRIVAAVLLMAPAGIFMGMLFPFGLRLCEGQPDVSLAWCWGINGMTSTCAAVYSIAISISYGISATFWAGVAWYLLAGLLAARMLRQAARAVPPSSGGG